MNDWQLLRDYAERGSESSFRVLLSRHLGLVHSAALRQVNDSALAEDVCQAVFVLLARKAASLRERTILSGWLFRTTRFVAARALRAEVRRQRREQEAVAMQQLMVPDDTWRNIAPDLDQALSRLGETDRNAVLLRFFEGKNHRQVGDVLGISEEAAKKRVARALEKLRTFFSGRGLMISATALASLLAANGAKPPPPALLETVIAAVRTGSGAAALSVLSLVNEGLKEMLMARLRLAGGWAAVLLLLTTLLSLSWRVLHFTSPPKPTRAEPTMSVATAATNASSSLTPATENEGIAPKFRLRVVNADDGHALGGAQFVVNYWNWNFQNAKRVGLDTGADGICQVPLGVPPFETLRVWVSAERHVPKVIDWHDYELTPPMEDYVIKLDRAWKLSGRVEDESGQPIAGAKIAISSPGDNLALRENVAYHPRFNFALSDEEGGWIFDRAPKDGEIATFFVTHDAFARLRESLRLTGPLTTNVSLVLRPGVGLAGIVLDKNEFPIADAAVEEDEPFGGPGVSTRTEWDGRFFLPHVNPGPIKLEVKAEGFVSITRTVEATTTLGENRFLLSEAIPPSGATLTDVRGQSPRKIHLIGTVVDGETGKPVDRFSVLHNERRGTQMQFMGEGRNGGFDWKLYPARYFSEYELHVQADGYVPEVSPVAKLNDPEQHFEFKLTKSSDIAGLVLSSDGQEAVGAEVFLGGKGFGPNMVFNPARGYFLDATESDQKTRTDSRGRFRFKPTHLANRVIVSHESGCAAVSLPELTNAAIVLQPWGRVEGILRIGNGFGINQTVGIEPAVAVPGRPYVPCSKNAKTDAEGHFVFERVPPGTHRIFRVMNLHEGLPGTIGLSHHTNVEVRAGETTDVIMGGTGRRVTGRIRVLPETVVVDWSRDLQRLVRLLPGLSPPKHEAFAELSTYFEAWGNYNALEAKFYLAVNPDASFVIDDVPPGDYRLELAITEPPSDPLSQERFTQTGRAIGSLKKEVTIPELPVAGGNEPFDLGALILEVQGSPKSSK